ncbi:MAG: T9SS type A sorting domain-containing protein, partial [Saprospiraceae bacterium]|nr:T9SS type A sorting domain-containing protein [Saprospiraceae bacterium]
ACLIDTLGTKYFIDTDRIYACGMSNGGFMSYRLACELSHRIAAVASVAGSMTTMTFSECQPQRPVPVMEIHGTSDLIVNYNGATGIKSISEVIERWTEQNNCPEIPEISLLPDLINEGSRVERQAYRPCAENSEVILLKVLDGGHTWPGSANSGIGNTNRDINANTEIWAFFNRFSLSGNPNPSREAHNKLDINVFPNPASSYLAVSLPEESKWRNGRLKLLHGCGQVVFQQEITNTKTELYLSDLPAGLYLLEVWTETGSATKRLVIH